MQVLDSCESLRASIREAREQGKRIGFVPTMGNLHDGHIALVRQAQTLCEFVVASIFVNRLQFGLNEDWDRYPRTLDADSAKLLAIGCNALFCPAESEIYPNGMETQCRVIVPTMSDILCGASRPGHFEGVTTVVSKLFNIVEPDVAVFGLKDYQQLAIIRRMVQDLCFPVELVAGAIVREPDGLAMSSRNRFIEPSERARANQLRLSLQWVANELEHGSDDFHHLEEVAREQIENAGFRVDYFQIRESHSLTPAKSSDEYVTVLGAMYTAHARLIDNVAVRRKSN